MADEAMRWVYVVATHPAMMLALVDVVIWGFILRDMVGVLK